MSGTYKTTGIILKGMPLGEADRLVTILTPEYGIVRAVAPGARKHKSQLRGRSQLFVVNDFVLIKGRSLEKIIQADTITSYAGLSRDLGKLSASQYLGELALNLALDEQPQPELYTLLIEHLVRIEKLGMQPTLHSLAPSLLAHLSQAVFHLLAVAGIAPQVHSCCLTQIPLQANFAAPDWQVGFSFAAGGVVNKSALTPGSPGKKIDARLGAVELVLLQQLGAKYLPPSETVLPEQIPNELVAYAWNKIEHNLRKYSQYQLGRPLRSATFLDSLPISIT